ncbi:YafY family protein [Paenibacillus sp. JX-17]|uniref:YafY family protein n=1 Tax=Paenibacillus lacisoli TaxID=3064525 RepID=A0ABT9CD80_9BACL|nr:YafY family protein [Paenibacillus sp. JX-17]MDO7905636.1 YafY family protein [Paenibacillus sp. JX-17]
MSKTDQMLSILWMLRSGKQMNAQQMSDQLEVHIRTVYRYIDSLCASGVPIIADSGPNGGYRLLNHFIESPLRFDMEEQKALVHASIFAAESGYPYTEALNRAVNKLKLYTNDDQLDEINRHHDGMSVIYPPITDKQKSHLEILEEAASQGITLSIMYDKGRRTAPAARELDPYGIVYWKGSWYTVGYCSLREELRSFRVDRITAVPETKRRFERPAGFSAKDFLMRNLLPDSLNSHQLINVIIQGQEQVLNELCQHWLFGHALQEREAGKAVFQLGQPSLLTYVPYFLLPYGRTLTILEPFGLVEKLAEVSSSLAEHYEKMKLCEG